MLDFWNGLGRRGRAGFVAGLVAIVLVVAGLGAWALRTPYGVLFSGLSQTDLAAMAGELDKMKLPYRVSDDGSQLLVPEPQVHKARLALMGRELPLHGAVGFELFNNVEFGTSEFVQKINYQRALQGELTRTILAIDEVQSARVHLALPEQGLFRRDGEKSKASVSLVLKPRRVLQAAQVQGIQRLVAASVPEVQPQDVTVLDPHGVPLTRPAGSEAAQGELAGAVELDLKASTEKYLTQKAAGMLDKAFGAGLAVVSVDAVFVQEQSRVTTEEVLPARSADPAAAATGVVVRERQSMRDGEGAAAANGPQVTSTETEYQVGRRTEQVSIPAGALKRLQVAVVVRRRLPAEDLQRVRDIVGASIGINRDRGDVVTVESIPAHDEGRAAEPAAGAHDSGGAALAASPAPARQDVPAIVLWLGALLLVAVLLAAMVAVSIARRRRAAVVVQRLGEGERERLLLTVKDWLAEGAPRTP